MVSSTHEVLHEFFRDRPENIDGMFRKLGHPDFPEIVDAKAISSDLTGVHERRADSVLEMVAKDGERFVLVIESQSERDDAKHGSWPYYVTFVHDKVKLPVVLVVVTQSSDTARWAAEPITISTDFWETLRLHPIVIGPEQVPLPAQPVAEEDLPMAVLGVLAHGRNPKVVDALDCIATSLKRADAATRKYYSAQISLALPETISTNWGKLMSVDIDMLMKHPLAGPLIAEANVKAEAKGQAEGEAKGVVRLLDRRGVALTPDQRERVLTCTDVDLLERWFDAAIDARSAEDVFDF